MSLNDEEQLESLLLTFDQLNSLKALARPEWSFTTAALRTIESLLARISLGSSPETVNAAEIAFPTTADPLFAWFLRCQDTFRGNTASQLLRFLERLETSAADGREEEEIQQIERWTTHTLNLLQGCLLLHEPSRSLFGRRPHMGLLIRLLGAPYRDQIHIETVQTAVSALVDRPDNLRTFENCGGLEAISNVFKSPKSSHEVRVKVLEFLYFYLIPESPDSDDTRRNDGASSDSRQTTLFHGGDTIRPVRRGTTEAGGGPARRHSREAATGGEDRPVEGKASTRRTTTEKQAMLGRYFNNIDALVKSLNEFKPFGEF